MAIEIELSRGARCDAGGEHEMRPSEHGLIAYYHTVYYRRIRR